MSKRNLRVARIVLVLLLALALSTLFVGSAQGDTTVISSDTSEFSFSLPTAWLTQSVQVDNFSDSTAFGSDKATLQNTITLLVDGKSISTYHGVGGLLGVLDAGTQPLDPLVAPLMTNLLGLLTGAGAKVVQQPTAHVFGGQYDGELTETSFGPIGVMHSDKTLLVAILLTDATTANADQLSAILESIRIPAGSTQPVLQQPTLAQPTLVTPATAAPTTSEPTTVRSSDNQVSLVIPSDWTLLDHIADQTILAYGDSIDAAQSRLYSAKPDLAPKSSISGNGGLIILYPMSQFGIDSSKPDLSDLMKKALGNLKGYTVESEAAPLAGVDGGLIAQISGAERGYLALIPFGDQIAYVTATGTTDSFDGMKDSLMAIVQSIHVPAVAESSGLGGLGGLESTPESTLESTLESTPEPTPEATAAGLGGLS